MKRGRRTDCRKVGFSGMAIEEIWSDKIAKEGGKT